ncbi:MAG: hypothetical protein NT091_05265, partial [Candidatus Falkowbacteria bacterium]|nr:hypothetical protein [Candidatus Falkowbacteria bacterium]
LHKYGFRFGLTEKRIDWAKKYFSDNQRKTLMLSKVVHGIGIAGLVTAGILNVPYSRFLKACLPISLIQSAILLLIGIFFGHPYKKIAQDLDYFAAATFALGAIALLIFWIQSRKKNKLK